VGVGIFVLVGYAAIQKYRKDEEMVQAFQLGSVPRAKVKGDLIPRDNEVANLKHFIETNEEYCGW
jgi:hypothetical protein